jgi:hypothetical protein
MKFVVIEIIPRLGNGRPENGTQTFQSVRPAEFLLCWTAPKQQREEFSLGGTGHRPVSRFKVPKPPSRGTQTFHLCGSYPAKICESLISAIRSPRQNHSPDEQLKLPPHRAFDRFATPASLRATLKLRGM